MKKVLALVLTVVLVLTMSVSAFATTVIPDPGYNGGNNNPWLNPNTLNGNGTAEGGNPLLQDPAQPFGHTRAQVANGIAWELKQRGIIVSDISGIIVSMSDDQYAEMKGNVAKAGAILTALGFSVAGDKWNAPLQADLTEAFVTNAVSAFGGVIPSDMVVSYNANSFAINNDWITATFTITNLNTQPGYSKWARQTVTVNWCYTHPWNPELAATDPPAAGTGNAANGNPLGTQTGDNTVAVALVSLFAVAGVLAIAARKSRNVA